MITDVIGIGFIDSFYEALPGIAVLFFAKKTLFSFEKLNLSGEECREQRGSEYFRIGEKV